MIGAIAGDIIGSVYEFNQIKTTEFELFVPESEFTDDTILTVAIADSLMTGRPYETTLREYSSRYPFAGYGGMFREWILSDEPQPYNSFGNGSAMRVSPVGFAFNEMEKVRAEAKKSAEVTHNHPEGIKGAESTAAAIFLARQGENKETIRSYIETEFGYNLHQTVDEIRPTYRFDETCQGTVPQAIIAFLDSTGFEDSIRLAVSLGGDSDTLACITGGIAQAYYKQVPPDILYAVESILTADLLDMVNQFNALYRVPV
jgi:ADP-ribosylglycohydrolase